MVRGEPWMNSANKYLEERVGLRPVAVQDREPEYDVPAGLHGRSRKEAAEQTHRMHMVQKQPYSHTEHVIRQRALEGQKLDSARTREYQQQLNKKLNAVQQYHERSRKEGGMSWRSATERKGADDYKNECLRAFANKLADEKRQNQSNTAAMMQRVNARPSINAVNTYPTTSAEERLKKGKEDLKKQALEYKDTIKKLKEAHKPQPPALRNEARVNERNEARMIQGLTTLKNMATSYYGELNDIDDKLEARKERNIQEHHERIMLNKQIASDLDADRQQTKKIQMEQADHDKKQLLGITSKIKKGEAGCSKFFPTRFAGYVPVVGTARGAAAKQRMQEVEEYGQRERILGAYGETVRRPRSQPARGQKQKD